MKIRQLSKKLLPTTFQPKPDVYYCSMYTIYRIRCDANEKIRFTFFNLVPTDRFLLVGA